MAVVRLSGLVTGFKGKIGGSVMQFGAGGQIMRNNRNFNRPTSFRWTTCKLRLTWVSQRWRALNPGDQATWDAMRPSFPTVDRFGNVRTPSAFELFMRQNLGRQFIGNSVMSSPGSPFTYSPIYPITLTQPVSGQLNVYWASDFSADEKLAIWASPVGSTGRGMRLGNFKFMTIVSTGTGGFVDITTEYINTFGSMPAGGKIWVKVALFSILNGIEETPVYTPILTA